MYRDENSIYCSCIVPHPFCFRVKGKTQLSDQPSYLLNCNVSKKYKDYPNLKETIRESNISISQGHLVCLCEQINVASISYTLFLWDINEQKNCQSFQCGFFYLDSLPNALTKRIFKFYRSVQDLPAKQHSQFSPDLVEMGWIGCAVQQANSKPIDRI